MDKEICFFIDDNTLFLDKVLVAFNDTPIFFVCCDSNGCYYLVLCTEIENLEYIIVKVLLQTIYRVLTQKIEMREPFVAADHFWYVKAGTSVYEDEVHYLDGASMDLDVLPYPNAKYETINKGDEAYVEKIITSYFSEAEFVSFEASEDDYISDSALDLPPVNMQPVAQYVELRTASGCPFSGVVKVFECSCSEKGDSYFYTEQMTQHTESTISNKLMNEILLGCIASLPEAA